MLSTPTRPEPQICRPLALAVCLLVGGGWSGLAAADWEPAETAPPIKPELLVHTLLGGPGDQRLIAVRSTRKGVQATDGSSLGIAVRFDEDRDTGEETIEVVTAGNKNLPSKKEPPKLLGGGGSVGGVSYGFKQVHSILQQPFANGRGWKLWGWSHGEAKKHNLMADSRIRAGLPMPNGDVLLIGWCDGGNTTLHRDPRDISKRSPYMKYKHGGGGGASNLFTQVTTAGEVVQQAFMGTGTGAVTWDPWGRLYAVGTNLCKGGKGSLHVESSGSLVIFDRDWSRTIVDVRLGGEGGSYKNNMWHAIDLDFKRGLLVLGGWSTGKLARPAEAVQDSPGGGKDAMLAVIRLWTEADFEAAAAKAKDR